MSIEARIDLHRGNFHLNVDLDLPAFGITAVFGPSGCGKTSLLRAIAGLEPSTKGRLRVAKEYWQDSKLFLPTHKRPLGYVFQEASLFEHLDVRANVAYGFKRIPAAERRLTLDHIIELLKIGPLLQRSPLHLSGGERQRVAIARALAVSPRLMLMDEPLAALDLQSKREILPYLEALRADLDIPILYVSHSPDEVARLADYLVLLEAGRARAAGPIGDMLTRLDLPLAQGEDAEALVEAVVVAHDDNFALTLLDFPGGHISVSRKDLPVGRKVRVRITARDVSLTLQQQTGTSILNIFPARIDSLAPQGESQMMVRLLAGEVPLLSRVTRKSVDALDLQPGKMVYAQAKSVALLS